MTTPQPTNAASLPAAYGHQAAAALSDHQLEHNITEAVRLGKRDRLTMGWSDHVADRLTGFSGSMTFVWLHALWFGVWVAVNRGWLGLPVFDPFPFGLLTMVVSLEAIFLSTFVLISQNTQARQTDRRAKVNMQVDVVAEQEITKLLQMVAEIHAVLGIRDAHDAALQSMQQPTKLATVADAIDAAEQRNDAEGAKGLGSAADSET
jgi:uncharacterized membrane protein